MHLFRLWVECFGHFAVFFLQACQISILHIENFFREKFFFPKIGSLYLFQLWRNFPIFWQAFEIFKLWHPVAQGEQILLWETFFPKNCCRTLSEIRSSAWPKNNSVRFLKLHSIGPVEIIWNNFFSDSNLNFFGSLTIFLAELSKFHSSGRQELQRKNL